MLCIIATIILMVLMGVVLLPGAVRIVATDCAPTAFACRVFHAVCARKIKFVAVYCRAFTYITVEFCTDVVLFVVSRIAERIFKGTAIRHKLIARAQSAGFCI